MIASMDPAKVPAVGDLAADFALSDADGRTRRLSELTAGGSVVLVFFRGHW